MSVPCIAGSEGLMERERGVEAGYVDEPFRCVFAPSRGTRNGRRNRRLRSGDRSSNSFRAKASKDVRGVTDHMRAQLEALQHGFVSAEDARARGVRSRDRTFVNAG